MDIQTDIRSIDFIQSNIWRTQPLFVAESMNFHFDSTDSNALSRLLVFSFEWSC